MTALTGEQYQQLHDFAAKRLRRLAYRPGLARCLAGKMPDDLVHAAFEKLLLGESHPKKGRRLPDRHRQNTETFLKCVQGIVNSDLSNAITAAEVSCPHLSWGNADTEPGTIEVSALADSAQLLEQRDVQRELFARLRQQAAPELQPIIAAWEPRFLTDDCISQGEFDRRDVHRVRVLARRILADLAREFQPAAPSGMEMLM